MREVIQYKNLQNIPFNIINITEILQPIFGILSQFEGSNIVVAFGDAGVGKSTLLSSLIYGNSNLEVKEIQNNRESFFKTKKVIDYKKPQQDFIIGHDQDVITTFIPYFYRDPKQPSLVYVDMGGLNL